jgi:hypothetical protein
VGLQKISQVHVGSGSFDRGPELLELCTVLKAPGLLLASRIDNSTKWSAVFCYPWLSG